MNDGNRKQNPLMVIGALLAGIGLAVWIGWPLLIPSGATTPGWPPWLVVVGGVLMLVGFFRRPG